METNVSSQHAMASFYLQQLATVFLLLLTCSALANEREARIAAFGRLPDWQHPSLAPDGTKVAALRPVVGVLSLVVSDLASRSTRVVLAEKPSVFHFNWCRWANNERLLCSIRVNARLKIFSVETETKVDRHIAINADGTRETALPAEKSRVPGDMKIIHWLPADPAKVLVQYRDGSALRPHTMDIYSGKLSKTVASLKHASQWISGSDGKVWGALTTEDGKPRLYAKVEGKRRLQRITAPFIAEQPGPKLLWIDSARETAYVLARNGRDRKAVWTLDISNLDNNTPLEYEASILEPDVEDFLSISALHTSGRSDPVAFQFVTDRLGVAWMDERWADAFDAVNHQLSSRSNVPISFSQDGQKVLIKSARENDVPEFFLLHRDDRTLIRLGSSYPEITGEELGPRDYVSFKSSDGMTIPMFVTYPSGSESSGSASAHRPLATIVLPHGGPISRDLAEFDYLARFLASEGYLVLQPQFRGSRGFGHAFELAGLGEWGDAMQEDKLAGLAWAIDKGIADPSRVAFVGASYGGYASLVAAFQEHTRLQCAVSISGISDLGLFSLNRTAYRRDADLDVLLLDISSRNNLRRYSPIEQIHRLNIPTLLIHGDRDRAVQFEQSEKFYNRGRELGRPVKLIRLADGDHYMSSEGHRKHMLQATAEFLESCLADDRQR